MQMRIFIGGGGATIPGLNIGFNAATGAIIDIRNAPDEDPYRLVIADAASLGTESGTLTLSHVITSWFPVNVARHPWLHRKNKLVGKQADLGLEGTLVANGEIDVKFTVYDEQGYGNTLMERAMLDARGFQLGSTKVRGVLKRWYSDKQFEEIKEERLREWENARQAGEK